MVLDRQGRGSQRTWRGREGEGVGQTPPGDLPLWPVSSSLHEGPAQPGEEHTLPQ